MAIKGVSQVQIGIAVWLCPDMPTFVAALNGLASRCFRAIRNQLAGPVFSVFGETAMRTIILGLFALMLVGTGAIAQPAPRPDFSGAWTMDPARSESAAQDQPIGPVKVAITQSGSEMKIETTRDGKSDVQRYPFAERPTMSTEVTGARRAFWDGPALVNEGSVDVQDRTVAFQESRILSADGREMVVETTLKLEHGYELKGTQTVVKGKNIFVRSR